MKKVILLVSLFFLISCTPKDKPMDLAFGFKSYMSVQEVKAKVKSKKCKWKIIEHTTLKKNDPRPPYDMLILEINCLKYLGVKGNTRLVFYNNRLMLISFYPYEKNNEKKPIDEHRLIWEDKSLQDEHNSWINKYS